MDCLHNIQICMSCLVQVLCHNILVIIFWVIFWSMLTPLLLVAEWWRISFRGRMKQSPVTQSIVSDAVSIFEEMKNTLIHNCIGSHTNCFREIRDIYGLVVSSKEVVCEHFQVQCYSYPQSAHR